MTFLSDDRTATEYIESCKWMQSLDFSIMRERVPALERLILEKLVVAAEQIANGKLRCFVEGRELDESSQVQFRESATHLLSLLRAPG